MLRDSRKCSETGEGNVYLPSSEELFIFIDCVFWFFFFSILTVESFIPERMRNA